ncbi:hypothetical protein ISCGN_011035 [Ixodes scapularis]
MDDNAALTSEFELPFSALTPTEREYVRGGLPHHPTETAQLAMRGPQAPKHGVGDDSGMGDDSGYYAATTCASSSKLSHSAARFEELKASVSDCNCALIGNDLLSCTVAEAGCAKCVVGTCS